MKIDVTKIPNFDSLPDVEKEAKEIFRKDGFIYGEKDTNDKLCVVLANKYANGNGNCAVSKGAGLFSNFKIGKTKIEGESISNSFLIIFWIRKKGRKI